MTMGDLETDYFPRGGKRTINKPEKRQHDSNLFNITKPTVKKARTQRTQQYEEVPVGNFQQSLNLRGTLNYSKLQEGMLVLGCIRQITNVSIQVELPGLIHATVGVNQISESFTNSLMKSLEEPTNGDNEVTVNNILNIGQIVPIKILAVDSSEKGHSARGSLDPKDINNERNFNSFTKGFLIWAAVTQELDHGYELTAGVLNCRVFLPFKNTEQKYSIGQPLYCTVYKIEDSGTASTLTVSTKKAHLDNTRFEDVPGLKDILPGTKVEFMIEQATLNGIKGTFLDTYFGYIDQTHFFSKITAKKAWGGKIIFARVLYTELLTKVTHLTMRKMDAEPEAENVIGSIAKAEVVANVGKGLLIKLSHGMGFVSNKRLMNCIPKDEDYYEAVARKFPNGSKHQCRVLDYNRLECTYICTFETSVVKEKIFSRKDLSLGQLVTVKVKAVLEKGLVVTAGLVQGFVPNMQLSNAKYYENIKVKFSPDMPLQARVLIIEENNVIFTLKQGFIDSENCLTSIENFDPELQYPGFVTGITRDGAQIVFYGYAKGWLTSKEINFGNSGKSIDPRGYFFPGQIVNVWVWKAEENKLILTLRAPQTRRSKVDIGEICSAIITEIKPDGFEVELCRTKINGFVPKAHLSLDPTLSTLVFDTYKVGDTMEPLMCLKNGKCVLLSRREGILHGKKCLKDATKMHHLKPNQLVSCSVKKTSKSGIYVNTTIKNQTKSFFISKPENGVSFPDYEQHHWILGQVEQGDKKKESTKLQFIPVDSKLDSKVAIGILNQNIEDIDSITKHYEELNSPLTAYKIGERVRCVIKYRKHGGCFVTLPNDTKGFVPPHFTGNKYKLGITVECVVLHHDFEQNHPILCFDGGMKNKIKGAQLGDTQFQKDEVFSCQTLLKTKFYTIAVLTEKQTNRQLIYLPNSDDVDEMVKRKVHIHMKYGRWLLAVPIEESNDAEELEEAADLSEENIEIVKNAGKPKRKKSRKVQKVEEELIKEVKEEEDVEVNGEQDEDEENIENTQDFEDENDENRNQDVEETEDVQVVKVSKKRKRLSKAERKRKENERKAEMALIEQTPEEEEGTEEESNETLHVEQEDLEEEPIPKKKRLGKVERLKARTKKDPKQEKVEPGKPLLSGVNSFYSESPEIEENSSSSDEEENTDETLKKKKLTKAERLELAKMEEERIQKVENELIERSTPQTPDQFDRALLADPNNSELWLRYIAMHVATTELDKARAVGKRALDTINISNIKDKFNVWVALLNLENMYGTRETFEATFQNAVKYNDSLEVYLTVIKMLASSGKITEMEEKIKKIRNKEKRNPTMWTDIGQVYYTLGNFKEARNVKEAALKSISDKKTQFDLIVKFGIMEFQQGEIEQAIASFEAIIEAFPSKIIIWSIYVDQLVKKKKVEEARQLLQRAIGQKFNMKCMKAIFQKFIHFEEQNGTEETLKVVKNRIKDYVASVKCFPKLEYASRK